MTVDDLLRRKNPVLFDGANGTEYQRRGLAVGSPPESWNLVNAPMVKKIHQEYLSAGSQIIETNTFGGNRKRLQASGLEDQIKEINHIGVGLALSASNGKALVAGSVGPLGALIEPFGDVSREEASRVFREQIQLLLEAGVHFIAIETMISLEEAILALEAAKDAGARTVSVTMTFEPTPQGPRTPFGESPTQVAEMLSKRGSAIVGSNCGRGFDVMRAVANEIKGSTNVPIIVQPNAGIPAYSGDTLLYPESPEQYAEFVRDMLSLGIGFIGGCCGTTPQHIAEANRIIRQEFVKMNG